jgi:hypothetical protein
MTISKITSHTKNDQINSSIPVCRAFFNYITTGAFTPVGPLFALCLQDSQMNWALLIISKIKVNLVEKAVSACFLIPSHILDIPSNKSENSQGWC